jgi:hypothetical protein
VTIVNRAGDLRLSDLASSPAAFSAGKVWLLASSALLADRPAVVSLIGFWIVGFAILLICSARVAAGVAVAGHLLSALAIYGVIGAARLVDPHAFASIVQVTDYGLSAIIFAWLGAIGCVLWRRHPAPAARFLVVVGALLSAVIGLLFRPDLTFLDSEHVLAFALGAALAVEGVRRSIAQPFAAVAGQLRARASIAPSAIVHAASSSRATE